MKPRSVHLRGFKGDQITGEVTIHAYEDLPLTLKPSKFSISNKVDYEIKTIEEGKIYRLTFQDKLRQKGNYRGILEIKTNYPEKPTLKIRVYGKIKGSLQVTPERIYLGRVDMTRLKTSKTKMVRSFKVKYAVKGEFKIEKIDYNHDLFEVKLREIEAGRIYDVELKLLAEKLRPGRLYEKLTMHTNLKAHQKPHHG